MPPYYFVVDTTPSRVPLIYDYLCLRFYIFAADAYAILLCYFRLFRHLLLMMPILLRDMPDAFAMRRY